MRVAHDSETDTSHAASNGRIPVVNLTRNAPLVGSLALSTPSLTPFYGDGLQWLPFIGAAALESGVIGILGGLVPIVADGTYRQVLFNSDLSPLTPLHPSFTIDLVNSQIVINTNGNYLLYYSLNPSNSFLSAGGTQVEKYASQLITSEPALRAFCQGQGGFSIVQGGLLTPSPADPEVIPYVSLSNTWSGFLPAGTTVQTQLSITVDNSPQNESLFGEGGRMTYMGIVRIA